MHDAFDTKGIAFHVKEQVAVKRSFYLNAPNVSEFGGLKVADRLKKAGRPTLAKSMNINLSLRHESVSLRHEEFSLRHESFSLEAEGVSLAAVGVLLRA
ncbi:MAG: hypothetical protein ORN51_10165, partial [Akkermansiaceae bacterium]|nr:hypothetical protein [Akkermansiaceae bacterium]